MLRDGIRILLLPQAAAPPVAVGLAIARAIRTEVQAAALACSGLPDGEAVWQGHTVLIVEGATVGNAAAA